MRILLSNDDGYFAPGLEHLAAAVLHGPRRGGLHGRHRDDVHADVQRPEVGAVLEIAPRPELEEALAENNLSPDISLVIRPGLAEVSDLVNAGAEPADDADQV